MKGPLKMHINSCLTLVFRTTDTVSTALAPRLLVVVLIGVEQIIFKVFFLAVSPLSDPSKTLDKGGTKGTPLAMGSNHVPVNCKNEAVYQYHVSFT